MSGIERTNRIPVVFISSTVEDLKPYRAAARDAAISEGFFPVMFEHWPAEEREPVGKCLAQVARADALVVIAAHRYGWVPEPPDQSANQFKSMTWLECEQALRSQIDVLAFLLDEGADWSEHLREEYRITKALREGKAGPELLAEVQRNVDLLAQFKGWLRKGRIRATFKNEDEFQGKLARALGIWIKQHPDFEPSSGEGLPGRGDPFQYLRALRQTTGWINLRGLQVESGKANRFPIEQLYIPLTTSGVPCDKRERERGGPLALAREVLAPERRRMTLEEALRCPRLVIIGDPGSGKTTFLRRLAFTLADTWLQGRAGAESLTQGASAPSWAEAGRAPVTVQEFRQFVDDEEGYKNERWWKAGGFGQTQGPEGWDEQVLYLNRPVVGVNWYEASAYCAWLSERLRLSGRGVGLFF